ncbi:MAG: hypothetical protein MJ129_02310 [Clostridia bacterium]|nr:hypothetical protein [Clostridia bacterium]
MPEIMIDVNGWQGLFDFVEGDPITGEGAYLELPKEICARHPYPGDLNKAAIPWVTDIALEVSNKYSPDLMVLSYATGNLMRVNSKLSASEKKELAKYTLSEAYRFAEQSGYEPIVVSTGNMKPIDNVLSLDGIEGYLSVSADPYMAGIFGAGEHDYDYVKTIEGITCETKESFLDRFNISDAYAVERTPDIVLYSDGKAAFTNTGGRGTTLEAMHTDEDFCFAAAEFEDLPDSIFDFRPYVDRLLRDGHKIAVIIAESIDEEDMPKGSKRMTKIRNGIHYTENVIFYYALLNGVEFNSEGTAYIFHNPFLKRPTKKRYPYSYIKTDKYQSPIGYNRSFKTASVGTRSGILHSATMSDYSFECHCRGLAESGLLVFINEKKLSV